MSSASLGSCAISKVRSLPPLAASLGASLGFARPRPPVTFSPLMRCVALCWPGLCRHSHPSMGLRSLGCCFCLFVYSVDLLQLLPSGTVCCVVGSGTRLEIASHSHEPAPSMSIVETAGAADSITYHNAHAPCPLLLSSPLAPFSPGLWDSWWLWMWMWMWMWVPAPCLVHLVSVCLSPPAGPGPCPAPLHRWRELLELV